MSRCMSIYIQAIGCFGTVVTNSLSLHRVFFLIFLIRNFKIKVIVTLQ